MKEKVQPIQCYFWGSLIVISNKCDEHKCDAYILQGAHYKKESSIIQITGDNAGSLHGSVIQDVLGTVASTPEAIIDSISKKINSPDANNIKISDHHITLSELFEIAKRSSENYNKKLFTHNINNKSPKIKSNAYKIGTIFVVDDYPYGECEREAYMLSEYIDENKFELTQITGYHAGYGGFFIKRKKDRNAISYEDLIEGIKYNFLKPDLKSLVIFEHSLIIEALLQVLNPFFSE